MCWEAPHRECGGGACVLAARPPDARALARHGTWRVVGSYSPHQQRTYRVWEGVRRAGAQRRARWSPTLGRAGLARRRVTGLRWHLSLALGLSSALVAHTFHPSARRTPLCLPTDGAGARSRRRRRCSAAAALAAASAANPRRDASASAALTMRSSLLMVAPFDAFFLSWIAADRCRMYCSASAALPLLFCSAV